MGRALMYAALLTLLLFVIGSYFLLETGGAEIAQPQDLTLHDLTSSPNRYDGTVVTTSGALHHNESLNRYEIIDADANFPLAINNFDETKLAALVGRIVHVSGKFGSIGGVHIDAVSVVADATPTPAPSGA